MTELKNSGIAFKGVTLDSLSYKSNIKNKDNRDLQIDYETKYDISPTGNQLIVQLMIIANKKKADTAPFVLEASLLGFFEKQGDEVSLKLEDFAKVNALAMMFPFIRELVFNVTCRSINFPPLIINPVNLSNLAETQKTP